MDVSMLSLTKRPSLAKRPRPPQPSHRTLADWFAEQFGRIRSNPGRRYTAETNVALPVRRALVG